MVDHFDRVCGQIYFSTFCKKQFLSTAMLVRLVSTEDSAANARSVVGLVCVNTEDRAANARNVVGLVSVFTAPALVLANKRFSPLVSVFTEDSQRMQAVWWIWSV